MCAQKLKDAKVTVIRLGATNMERYNYTNNRMYNVATGENQYVPMSWGSFVNWCREDIEVVPFLLVPVYGHVAGEGSAIEDTVTEVNGDAQPDHEGWQKMLDSEDQWNQKVFPDRGDDPNITGWETDMNRNLSQYLIRAKEYEDTQSIRVADYMDVHRYFRKETDYDAIQETRGLWQDAFQSQDSEVKGNTETKVLKRFQNMVNAYYPETELSFSEYDYFYWNGHPELPQVAAVGQMDFLGFFARMGVKLACNWYYVIQMEKTGIEIDNGAFTYEFQPLSIYVFVLSSKGLWKEPKHISM
jgi:hypothetical protein